ncbi:hypothetical protein ISN45_Aa04g010590 [Arabidopsis thaliana x Arabidopsis arenosa]|uniref:Uncharacterized protein n=1 Tax=Arabidopsis thaliana x Arabidopsis arenosa TaxID=1240361 RepID=A0A8T2A6B9_9BRAS|nr:hypothetical protein ISN45_Aa04g010590 [Arabidopsis thaliana x Arabidopsis arenosa]
MDSSSSASMSSQPVSNPAVLIPQTAAVIFSQSPSGSMNLPLCSSELKWISALLQSLGIPQSEIPEMYCDNLSAVYLTANPALHSRSKHFDVDFHYVRERVAHGALVVKHIPAEHQLADIFTKSLAQEPFFSLRYKLGVSNPPTTSLRGCIEEKKNTLHQTEVLALVSQTEVGPSQAHSISDKEQRKSKPIIAQSLPPKPVTHSHKICVLSAQRCLPRSFLNNRFDALVMCS